MKRPPTSHERAAGRAWDASYQQGPAPWEWGRPQRAMARLAEVGAFIGPVLDCGCGSDAHAVALAERGIEVLGVDVAKTALARARQEAAAGGLAVEFGTADALNLAPLGGRSTGDRAVGTVGQVGAGVLEIHAVPARPRQTKRRGPDRDGAPGGPRPGRASSGSSGVAARGPAPINVLDSGIPLMVKSSWAAPPAWPR